MKVSFDRLVFKRGGRVILHIDELVIPASRTTVLLGPNGAGKTSLLRLIAGLERPQSGTICLGDAQVDWRHPPWQQVAFAFQQAVFLRGTVADNLELGLRLRGMGRAEREERIREVADRLAIDHLLDRDALALSHGEAQRANLARTLSLPAKVTLLDEPLAGLDGATRDRMVDELPGLLAELSTTTIVVTHDRDEALRIADVLVAIDDGRVVGKGEVTELLREPPNAATARLLGFGMYRGDDGVVAVPPGGLRVEAGEPAFEMIVERVVDLGGRREAVGRIDGQRARARLDATSPRLAAGETITVCAAHGCRLPAADAGEDRA